MIKQIYKPEYDFISDSEKEFIIEYDKAIRSIGYDSDGIKPYVTFGKYKIEYSRVGLKTKKVIARFYFRDSGIVLRLYFNNIDKKREYIENAIDYIKLPFVDDNGRCKNCDKDGGGITGKSGKCTFKKSYTIDGELIEKCSGENFYFNNYELSAIPEYMELITAFYPKR